MANPRISDMLRSILTSKFTDKTAFFAFARETEEELLKLKEMVEEGEIKPVVDQIYSFKQAAAAHRRVETEKRLGSVVISLAM
jgi:NADPH:quinone reductase-like Zn-dependent oxidoreductase